MTDAVNPAEPAAPDANVLNPETETENVADSSTAAEETSEVEQPKAKGVQKRLDELTRNWREAERREAQLLELLKQRDQPKQEASKPVADDKPKTLADFDYDEAKFQAYIFEQAEKRSVEAAKRELQQAQERETAERRKSSFAARQTEFAKTVEDYDEVVRNPRLPITQAMADVIQESDDGPALAYHLGKNPDIAEKIAMLPPIAAARELGKIEARLAYERERAKEKPVVSKAPPPPPKVDASQPAIEKDPDEMSTDEWLKWRQKQLRKKA